MSDEKCWTVWVGGVEVNSDLLTYPMALRLAELWREDDYDDVVVEKVSENV